MGHTDLHRQSVLSRFIFFTSQFSTHLCHHRHSHHPSLLHFFTPDSKPRPTFSTNPFHLNFSSLLIGLPSRSWDWTGLITLISLVFFSFIFVFVPCGRLSSLSVSFLLRVKYTVSYRVVSYRIVSYVLSSRACLMQRWRNEGGVVYSSVSLWVCSSDCQRHDSRTV